jgi:hypothetical protein
MAHIEMIVNKVAGVDIEVYQSFDDAIDIRLRLASGDWYDLAIYLDGVKVTDFLSSLLAAVHAALNELRAQAEGRDSEHVHADVNSPSDPTNIL